MIRNFNHIYIYVEKLRIMYIIRTYYLVGSKTIKNIFLSEKFWELLGGKGTYEEVLEIFDEVGKEFKEKIQNKIKEVAEKKMDV